MTLLPAIKKLPEFLQDQNGDYSSTRLFMFLVAVSTIIDWQHAIWATPGGIWTPTFQTVGMVLGVLGFKVGQSYIEGKSNLNSGAAAGQ